MSESTDDKPAVLRWDVGDLGQREGWAEYLSEIDVSLPGRKATARQPAAAELSSLWSEAPPKPEKCLIKISTRTQKRSPRVL